MKICIIGNAAAGKTRLSRHLGERYQVPVTHVDSLQFNVDLSMKPHPETRQALQLIQSQSQWIIDGYGPLDDLQTRLVQADWIVFFDWPLWRNYWWGSLRFVSLLWRPRQELPRGHSELRLDHIQKFYQGLKKVHRLMRPELLRILERPQIKPKTLVIRSRAQLQEIYRKGLPKSP